MSEVLPFSPSFGSGQTLAVTTGNQTTNVPGGRMLRMVNLGTASVYVRLYDNRVTPTPVATVADYLIPAGVISTITRDVSHNTIAYLGAAAGSLNVMGGHGA